MIKKNHEEIKMKSRVSNESKVLNKKIGAFLKKCRREQGISGVQAAEYNLFSQQQLSRYERGVNAISISLLNEILQKYNVSWDRFFVEVIIDMYNNEKKNNDLLFPCNSLDNPLQWFHGYLSDD